MNGERTERLHDPNIQAISGVVIGILFSLPVLGIQIALKLMDHYFPDFPWWVQYTLHLGNILFLLLAGLVILLSFKRKQGNKGVIISKTLCLILISLVTLAIWFKF
ncbi:MAG: hypothetical protein AABZ60_25015 [Planctomycetota bacterium]